jgi:hypothetical protein
MPRFQTATCAAVLASAIITATAGCSSSTQDDSATNAPENAKADSVTVGEVPGRPEASAALQNWVDDLETGFITTLVKNCWTIAPERVETMYAEPGPILDAVAQPGTEGQFAYIWQDDKTRVSIKRSEIASGYACPYVSAIDDRQIYTEADAKYRVFRYLQRSVGNPVSRDDTEANYRLECNDFSDASRTAIQGVMDYKINSMAVTGKPDNYVVTVDTLTDGKERKIKITTAIEDEGYCLQSVK